MTAVVIADASPLVGLARIDGLAWLQALFQQVLVTDVVIGEVLTGSFPGSESRIQASLNTGWLKVVSNIVCRSTDTELIVRTPQPERRHSNHLNHKDQALLVHQGLELPLEPLGKIHYF